MPASRLNSSTDVVVIGAGAAGLAAAAELAAAGRSVLVLEARERVGGRCWTRRMAGLDIPVELGAEFIHGAAKVTFSLLEQAGLGAVDSVRSQRYAQNRRLRPVNAFAEAQRAVQGFDFRKDLSFEALLQKRRLPAKTRTFARMMVQGFDAADPRRVSARSIAEEWGGGSLGASQQRPQGGYGALMDWLAQSIVQRGVRLRLGATVSDVKWKPGRVTVSGTFLGERFVTRAERAIVTLPLGVLQSHATGWLAEKRAALRRLASGPVIRVALRFERAFWEERAPGIAFFHAPAAPFPTLWTPLPMRAPLLTAWAGGPKAARLTGAPRRELVRAALASVRSLFRRDHKAELAAVYVHDWQQDPLSRGAYSYLRVAGAGAREELARPLDQTLFFAGEATDVQEAGTVAGALRSGRRAARELLSLP
jgi:monoamine oxidase